MKFIFIIAFLCLNLITSREEIELAKRIQFEGETNEFTYNIADVQNNVFLIIIEYEDNIVFYTINCPHQSIQSSANSGKAKQVVFSLLFPGECTFSFIGIGNFTFYSFKNSVPIDLNDTYGNINIEAEKINIDRVNEPNCELTFLFNNLESDVLGSFDYNKEKVRVGSEYYDIENPFKICVKEKCEKGDIQEYKFIKNNNYKIIVEIQVIIDKNGKKNYVFPGFSFSKK